MGPHNYQFGVLFPLYWEYCRKLLLSFIHMPDPLSIASLVLNLHPFRLFLLRCTESTELQRNFRVKEVCQQCPQNPQLDRDFATVF
jgi:hypothetical protein